ncbi:hypothetical protein SAMN05421770_105197 [Granulicella rosea]|uniref:Uncharacterized protein n=1 Tax=Granulicella rosea TaxID=474952 RepID=A0A239KUX9_9BACT|nr:hypothetical protein SAMN05421770_105197 [Granulicella rosea]
MGQAGFLRWMRQVTLLPVADRAEAGGSNNSNDPYSITKVTAA